MLFTQPASPRGRASHKSGCCPPNLWEACPRGECGLRARPKDRGAPSRHRLSERHEVSSGFCFSSRLSLEADLSGRQQPGTG